MIGAEAGGSDRWRGMWGFLAWRELASASEGAGQRDWNPSFISSTS